MNHLTVDEIISFLSISKIDAESLELASNVNSHLIKCEQCRSKVRAFRDVFDSLFSAEGVESIRANTALDELISSMEQTAEARDKNDEFIPRDR